MASKATAVAHPIQGVVKYHGMRDPELRFPYHDSISVCTAPSKSRTTVAFEADRDEDRFVLDGDRLTGRGADRLTRVIDRVRTLAEEDRRVRLESVNEVPSNVGFGSSSSGFAAAAVAAAAAAQLELGRPAVSAIARRGSASAARAVTGGFSILKAGVNDIDCRSERLESPLDEELRILAAPVPSYKETERAHAEAVDSHMFEARLAHVHGQLAEAKQAIRAGEFDTVGHIAEHDSLSLAATTMTGPSGWVYWAPKTLEIFDTVRQLRDEADIPVYFSTDTGASVYVNTTAEYVDRVASAVKDCGVDPVRWRVGGPARVVDAEEAVF